MNVQHLKTLSGVPFNEGDTNDMLNEAAVIPATASIETVMSMLDAAKRGLGFANKLSNVGQRKKHVRAIFINLNKIRSALSAYLDRD